MTAITLKQHFDKIEDLTLKLILFDYTTIDKLNQPCYTLTGALCKAFEWKKHLKDILFGRDLTNVVTD
jgi:hypothetical protein